MLILITRMILSAVLLGAALVAVHSRSLVSAALYLTLGSSSLALLFFLHQAPYAGSVQLSVGAGVMSALFILAISLTSSLRGGDDAP